MNRNNRMAATLFPRDSLSQEYKHKYLAHRMMMMMIMMIICDPQYMRIIDGANENYLHAVFVTRVLTAQMTALVLQ
jgi:hypothetical protein